MHSWFRLSRRFALCPIAVFFLISACYGQGFTLTAIPSSLTIYPGQQNVALTISASGGTYTGSIGVTLTGLPSGIVVSPLNITTGSSGTINLSASVSAGQEGFPPTGPSMITSWTASAMIVGAGGGFRASLTFPLTVSISNPAFAPGPSAINLPVVNINTGGIAIISKTTDIPGTITITSADGQTSYLPNASDSDNTATFHVHGHSTALMPKLAYDVKLDTSIDLLNTMGLVCPYITDTSGKPTCDKSKSYVLLANYDDKTLLRDWSASALANAIPIGNGYLNSPPDSPTPSGTSVLMPWAAHSLFVELYLNGVYEGSYQLIEEVKVDSHRVDIAELTETDISPSQITGGYLMEIDQYQDEAFVFMTPQGLPIGLIDPDFTPDPEIPEQTSYISGYVDAAETALFSADFTDPAQGWRAYFDEASAVNFYIVNDVMGNVDGGDFYSSNYLYKDANNPLIYMGPVWDFDISSGNTNYAPIVNATVPWMQTNANWYMQWFQDPGFKAEVIAQWNALKNNGVFSAWLASIRQESLTLEQTQVNNFGRWPMQGIEVWPNPQAAGSYTGEVDYLINWINLRIAYLDSLFNNKAATSTGLGSVIGPLTSGSPVTLTAQVSAATPTGTPPTGVISFMANGTLLGTGTAGGGGTASLTISNLPAGMDGIQAVYNGDTQNALSASAVQTVIVAPPLAATITAVSGRFSDLTENASPDFSPAVARVISPPAPETSTVFLSATVLGNSGSAVPTGTIAFSVDLGPGATVPLDGTGQASFAARGLSPGQHSIAASYSGDGIYSASNSPPFVFVAPGSLPKTFVIR